MRGWAVVIPLAILAAAPVIAQDELRLVMPPRVFAVPGIEANVYFDNISLHRGERPVIDVDCPLGAQQQERWTCVPEAEQVGEHEMTLRLLTPQMTLIEEKATTVEVVDPTAGVGEELTVLCVGDSLTAASVYTRRLVELFGREGEPAVTLIGESGPADEPANRHEGYGGWTCASFATRWGEADWAEQGGGLRRQRSPFVFEVDGDHVLDFQRYLDANNSGEPPDFITVLLGCNDTFSAGEEQIEERIDAMFAHLEALLAAFRAAAPEAEIGLLTLVPPAAGQDAFAANYRCGQTRWQYRRTQHRVVEREYETYGGREDERLFLVPAHVSLDTVYGFPAVSRPANAHTTSEVRRMSNGVHPSAAGYRQIGDAVYCWLKSRLAVR